MGEGFFPHFVRRNNAEMPACVRKKRASSNLGAGKFAILSPIFEVLYLHFQACRFCFRPIDNLESDKMNNYILDNEAHAYRGLSEVT